MKTNAGKVAELSAARLNYSRYSPGSRGGLYESFFQRANHPRRPLAFWIRYTLFSPRGRPEEGLGELWAVYFNGETMRHVALRREVPVANCTFSDAAFRVEIDGATLGPGRLKGSVWSDDHVIAWDMSFTDAAAPLFLLPPRLYESPLPKAKSLVGAPLARFSGSLTVDGTDVGLSDWVGSQNHNWGSRHTDHYAWGQIAGFDDHPQSFLEVATGRIKIGPLWTPPMTLLVLRHAGEQFALNGLRTSLLAHGRFDYFNWEFQSRTAEVTISGTISAGRDSFVGLNYLNPPGGSKHCLNTKIASCKLEITRRTASASHERQVLHSENRAAFEILTDDRDHGVTISA
ncbi:MAG: hypothetical protein ACE5D3_07735 [Candidatus Binatia bacterium]